MDKLKELISADRLPIIANVVMCVISGETFGAFHTLVLYGLIATTICFYKNLED